MGIYTRYAAAVLVLFTSSAFSATRVPVKPTSETVITGARTGAISTPAGDVAFYGADKVYSFTAGDSVAPTVREVKSTVGSVSYPYGPGAAYPNDPTYSASAATKIKVKPVAVVPKTNIAKGLKKLVKLNPGQLALGVATSAALSAVGWLIDEGSQSPTKGEIVKPSPGEPAPLDQYSWKGSGSGTSATGSSALDVMEKLAPQLCYEPWRGCQVVSYTRDSPTTATAYVRRHYQDQTGNIQEWPIYANTNSVCPSGYSVQTDGSCTSDITGVVPVTDTDLQQLDPWVSSQTAPFLADLLKEVCKASTSPATCYSEMEDRSKRTLQGPATAAGPWFTKTSMFPRPDGTTGTKTETTSTKYDFTYGPEHFDVTPERKTTTTEDGAVTSETTETDETPAEDVSDTPDEETPPEESYTFNDSDLPAVEPFYTQKYPDGFQGVWNSAKADFDQSAFVSFLNSFVPSFSGSCPAFSMSFAIGSVANFGTHGFGNLCYALDFVKVCIMLGALFLCRAIVFGG